MPRSPRIENTLDRNTLLPSLLLLERIYVKISVLAAMVYSPLFSADTPVRMGLLDG